MVRSQVNAELVNSINLSSLQKMEPVMTGVLSVVAGPRSLMAATPVIMFSVMKPSVEQRAAAMFAVECGVPDTTSRKLKTPVD
jgi:hypothetical protein